MLSDRINVLKKLAHQGRSASDLHSKKADDGIKESYLPSILKSSVDQTDDQQEQQSIFDTRDDVTNLSRAKSMKSIFKKTNKEYRLRFKQEYSGRASVNKSTISIQQEST